MANSAPKPAKRPAPSGGRRNFRLSPLEILIVVLIFVGLLYLLTMWATNMFTPGEEAAAPAAPPSALVERALVASEKVLAEQTSLSREVTSLRKQVDSLQAQARKTQGGGAADPTDAAQDRRLDEVDRRLDELSKRGGKAVDLQPLQARLDKLEKDLAGRPAGAPAPAADHQISARLDKLEKEMAHRAAGAAAPAVDPQVLSRLDKLEKALAGRNAGAPAPAVDPQINARLDKLEKELASRAGDGANPAAAALVQQESRLQRLESALQELRDGQARGRTAPGPSPAPVDPQVLERLSRLEKALEQKKSTPPPAETPAAAPAPTAAPAKTTPPPAKAEGKPSGRSSRGEGESRRINHKVRPGETLGGLARRYKVSIDDIVRWNAHQLGTRRLLLKGESLVILPGQGS